MFVSPFFAIFVSWLSFVYMMSPCSSADSGSIFLDLAHVADPVANSIPRSVASDALYSVPLFSLDVCLLPFSFQ